jgi:hypothetical protein
MEFLTGLNEGIDETVRVGHEAGVLWPRLASASAISLPANGVGGVRLK